MAYSLTCTNKGCGQLMSPYLDPKTNKVFCSSCHKEIENVNVIIKNQMKMSKQFRKKEKKSFAIQCPLCSVEDRPKLINDKIICSACNKEMKLPYQIATMLKMNLKNTGEL